MTHSSSSRHQSAGPCSSAQTSDPDGGAPSPGGSEPSDDPHSPGPEPLAFLLGSLIGLMTAIVPLATVVAGRQPPPQPSLFYGSQPPAGIPSARAGESGGGDSGR